MPSLIRPGVDRENRWFWDGVAAGQLLIQRCTACGQQWSYYDMNEVP